MVATLFQIHINASYKFLSLGNIAYREHRVKKQKNKRKL